MLVFLMVASTGIEPVTLGLEVPCSIQLSYEADCSTCVLCSGIITKTAYAVFVVHPTGFEPMTSRSASERSIHLSYGCMLLLWKYSLNFGTAKVSCLHFVVISYYGSRLRRWPSELRVLNNC